MSKWEWDFGNLRVTLRMGPVDDSKMDLVVKSKSLPMGVNPIGQGGLGITMQEPVEADNVEYWPSISMLDQNRRKSIKNTITQALSKASECKSVNVGIFTLGLEVANVPSWEVAEEIAKAVYQYAKENCQVEHITIVVSSPTQMSSFQYAFDNASILI